MTARQKKFAEYYAQSGNTVQSAIKAGYSEKYAKADGRVDDALPGKKYDFHPSCLEK